MTFGVPLFNLYLKYIIVGRNLKLLFKHHWLHVMTVLKSQSFCPLKFIKVTLKIFKGVKATKFGYKVIPEAQEGIHTTLHFWLEDGLIRELVNNTMRS